METNELTQPAVKLMNWCRELTTMSAEEFMVQYNSLSNTVKKHILTISAVQNQQTTCTFPGSGFTPVNQKGIDRPLVNERPLR